MAVQRSELEAAVNGRQKTWRFRVTQDGNWLDLTSLSVVSRAAKPDGNFVVPTVTKATDQQGDKGRFTVVIGASDMDTDGEWKLDNFIGTSGSEEPTNKRWKFQCEPKETEA